MNTLRSRCVNIGEKWFFHPIYYRYPSAGIAELGNNGWYEVAADKVTYCEWTSNSGKPDLPMVFSGDTSNFCNLEEVVDAIKFHYALTHFGVKLPPERNEIGYEIWARGVNYGNKVLNLVDSHERAKSLGIIFFNNKKGVVDSLGLEHSNEVMIEVQKLSQVDFGLLMKYVSSDYKMAWDKVWKAIGEVRPFRPNVYVGASAADYVVETIHEMSMDITRLKQELDAYRNPRNSGNERKMSYEALDEAARMGRRIQWKTSSGKWIDMKSHRGAKYPIEWKYPLDTYRIV